MCGCGDSVQVFAYAVKAALYQRRGERWERDWEKVVLGWGDLKDEMEAY